MMATASLSHLNKPSNRILQFFVVLFIINFASATFSTTNFAKFDLIHHDDDDDIFINDDNILSSFNNDKQVVKRDKKGDSTKSVGMNYGKIFSVNVTLGEKQFFQLNLDTTTNNVWVYNSSVSACEKNKKSKSKDDKKDKHSKKKDKSDGRDDDHKEEIDCATGARYHKEKSDGYYSIDHTYNVTSPDRSYSSGEYAMDTLKMGNIKIDNFTFGLVNTTTKNSSPGIFGLGFKGNGAVTTDDDVSHDNFMSKLKFSNLDLYPLTSFYFKPHSKNGSVLFGAIDEDKFNGTMSYFDLSKSADGNNEEQFPYIQLSAIGTTSSKGVVYNTTDNHFDEPVMIDSTSTMNYLPYRAIVDIATQMGASYAQSDHFWHVNCGYIDSWDNGTVDFYFYDQKISVPLVELVYPLYNANGSRSTYLTNGDPVCALKFLSKECLGHSVIGTTVLSHIYTVFDYNVGKVGIAQSNSYPKKENIKVVSNNLTKFDRVNSVEPSFVQPVTTFAPNVTAHLGPRYHVNDGTLVSSGSEGAGAAQTEDSPLPQSKSTAHTTSMKGVAVSLNSHSSKKSLFFRAAVSILAFLY